METGVHIRFRTRRFNNVSQTQLTREIQNSLPVAPETDPPRSHGTILLVEDETFLLDVTCEILESVGYRVLKTRNAAEAMNAFRQFHAIVRLLMTDVVLPGQSGRDLANDLRNICPDLRVIFISGYPENVVTRHGIQEEGMFYLPKPFSLPTLTRKVRQALKQGQTEIIKV